MKVAILLFVLIGTFSFADCEANADNLIKEVVEKKLVKSGKEELKFMEPEQKGKEYNYIIYENKNNHIDKKAFIKLDMQTGTAYKYNVGKDDFDKIYQNKKFICK